jgi:hypothetical protein
MAFFGWAILLTNRKRPSPQSKFILISQVTHLLHGRRERREHRVFRHMLQAIPGLEARLIGGSEEEVVFIADMVSV